LNFNNILGKPELLLKPIPACFLDATPFSGLQTGTTIVCLFGLAAGEDLCQPLLFTYPSYYYKFRAFIFKKSK